MTDDKPQPSQSIDDPLDPSGIAQFVEHDRCPRYIKQRVAPDIEPAAREWREAFGLMNVALLGHGQEFEATQLERLATNATKIIGPELDEQASDGIPALGVDETWADSPEERTAQLQTAVTDACELTPVSERPFILCYQAPVGGRIGDEHVWGEIDCLVLAPALADQPSAGPDAPDDHLGQPEQYDSDVVARVLDIKSASEEKPAHRVQVAMYSALLEQTLAVGPTPACRIETSVLTQATVESGPQRNPFDIPTFRRGEWELFAEQLLAADGPIDEALSTDLTDLQFALDQVCDNCAYREACTTRAVEDPTDPASLALLGLTGSVQRGLEEEGFTSLREVATLVPRRESPQPTDEPPTLDIDPETRRTLEELLPGPVHETIQRAQALLGKVDPDYPTTPTPQALPGKDWIPLPDDRCPGWGNIDSADTDELVHVALFVRPDTTIDRVAALGACVHAEAQEAYITLGEVIDAVPDDPDVADRVERELFERFLDDLFDAIERVATDIGEPSETVLHCYTFSEHEKRSLAEGLDRHADCQQARALRTLMSLHSDGHTDRDQEMISAVQPILHEHFALQYPSQGLLTMADQFVPGWTLEAFDPLDARPDDPPLRVIFREQFLNQQVPYLAASPGIHLHLAREPLGEGPAAAAADTGADSPAPDGWYPLRRRAGGQFPIEYIWACTPEHPDENTPRLTPHIVDEWSIDADDQPLYRQEIEGFTYRTNKKDEPLQQADVGALVERLSYALLRLVTAIPYKDAYHSKDPLDVTALSSFDGLSDTLPAATRDYLHIEFGAHRETTIKQYRSGLRERARRGRSIPIRCTAVEHNDDGSLTITANLAYEKLFDDAETARQIASQARIRSTDGPGGGSWRVCTPIEQPASTDETSSSSDQYTTAVEDAEAIKHSPPVLVDDIDHEQGTIRLTALPHRFRQYGSQFRIDHCGWQTATASNVDKPETPPKQRPGYVAERPPVRIDPGQVYILDPMLDSFSAPKADRALQPETISENALWQHLQMSQQTGTPPWVQVAPPAEIERVIETMCESDACLTPNKPQQEFIKAVNRPLVPLQGPPGTGKTSGATAPAMLARAVARARQDRGFTGLVIAPSHEAVDAALDGVCDWVTDWEATTGDSVSLELVRVVPATPTDTEYDQAAVTTCSYHSPTGDETLQRIAKQCGQESVDAQQLLFATPATLYHVLGAIAETHPAIDGTSAPAAMRHGSGVADVVCLDEASMLDLPRLFLTTSVLKPTGQTLLVGDHRQLATVTDVDWTDTLRKPLEKTQAYRSALEYVQWLYATGQATAPEPTPKTDAGTRQSRLSGFSTIGTPPETGGDQ